MIGRRLALASILSFGAGLAQAQESTPESDVYLGVVDLVRQVIVAPGVLAKVSNRYRLRVLIQKMAGDLAKLSALKTDLLISPYTCGGPLPATVKTLRKTMDALRKRVDRLSRVTLPEDLRQKITQASARIDGLRLQKSFIYEPALMCGANARPRIQAAGAAARKASEALGEIATALQ